MGNYFSRDNLLKKGKKDVKKERNIGRNLSLQYLPKSRSRLPFMQFGQDSLGHFPTFQCRPYLSFSADKEQLGTNRIFFFCGMRSPDETHLFHPASICSCRDGLTERERGIFQVLPPCHSGSAHSGKFNYRRQQSEDPQPHELCVSRTSANATLFVRLLPQSVSYFHH